METNVKSGAEVVSSDDHRIGRVLETRDDFVLVETGHVFKSTRAIPAPFLHVHDGLVRATVSKDIVDASPQIDDDGWSPDEVLTHYGLGDPVANGEPDEIDGPDPQLGPDDEVKSIDEHRLETPPSQAGAGQVLPPKR
jgi:hypothetical protein